MLNLDAPVACKASMGPCCDSSKASPNSLPINPIERKAMANAPASGPGPKTATKRSAQTRELMLREETRIKRASQFKVLKGVILLATITPTGIAKITAKNVPSVAIWIVSSKAS